MIATMKTTGPVSEVLRMIRATIRSLTSVATAEPVPYWADYLRQTRDGAK